MNIVTLVDLAKNRAALQPHKIGYTFIASDGEEQFLTYLQLDTKARAIASRLQKLGLQNQRALLLYLPGFDYISAYFGCLYAGVVAVPAYPPDPSRMERTLPRLVNIIKDCDASVILTTSFISDIAQESFPKDIFSHDLKWLSTDVINAPENLDYKEIKIKQDSLAFLQYTSGSTSAPRGVMLNHGALLRNLHMMQSALDYGENPHAVSWLPPYHDMGLIGGILQPLYSGFVVTLMSPLDFLAHPARWLQVMSEKKATASAAPNFAYDLCVRRISPEDRDSFDLSRWKVAVNGAEPVKAATMTRFTEYFSSCGFEKKAFFPCYGLAEATLYVSGGANINEPTELFVDAAKLEQGIIAPIKAGEQQSRTIVGCAQPLEAETLRIVDHQNLTQCSENQVGEIWLKDASVASGYWGKPELSESHFAAHIAGTQEGPFLRTGDLGFLRNGELFVTGRIKDIIIVRGSNYYPHDIEESVENSHANVRAGCVAVFALEDSATESIGIVLEAKKYDDEAELDELITAIVNAVAHNHNLAVGAIAIIKAKSIAKTSSGKIQRQRNKQLFQKGTLECVRLWKKEQRNETLNKANKKAVKNSKEAAESSFLAMLKHSIAQVMGIDGQSLAAEDILSALALDSLMKQELLGDLEKLLGRVIPPETFEESQSLSLIADRLAQLPITTAKTLTQDSPVQNIEPDLSADFAAYPEYQMLKGQITALANSGLDNPFFTQHQGCARDTTVVNQHALINFSNYNYLGLSGDARVSAAAKEAIDQYGTSVSASRLVSGERPVHELLEKKLAVFIGVDDSIVYVSGHATNVSTIGHLFGPGDVIFYDSLSHDSIQQGIRLSGAKAIPVPHNNYEALDKLMSLHRNKYRRALVVIEGVYSMDGDIPNLPQYIASKKHHHAFLMVDEAHSIGTLGKNGRGICEHFGVNPHDVDILMGTMSKSLSSCGGYIAGSKTLIEYLKYTSPGFVFSVGISPANAAAALKSLEIIEQTPELVTRLHENSALFLKLAKKAGIDTGLSNNTPVVPYIIGNSQQALILAQKLQEEGINVRPIVYPAVEDAASRLRFFITATHTHAQIESTVKALAALKIRSL